MDMIQTLAQTASVEELLRQYGQQRWIYEVLKIKIQADPCRDWRVIMRRYHVSRGFVYKVWNAA